MYVLCDTCSILMLIQIVPNMFTDKRFDCVTIDEVRREIFRTQRFKSKYPWREKYKDKIKSLPISSLINEVFNRYFSVITLMLNEGVVNKATGRIFNLSNVDQKIIAFALINEYKISSEDEGIIEFAMQEFASEFKGNITPLALVNQWLGKNLIKWDETKHAYLREWYTLGEPRQPAKEIRRFEKITGYEYVGS